MRGFGYYREYVAGSSNENPGAIPKLGTDH